ncbi:MAG: methylenetetrahydrofolate reductase C-terminal domain-containing protein [Candidatus Aadella gelida]|nr:methylenetetrahydrofolate reductase C-terminal domain-containing protein [Candidatus Aadella gelida]
MIITRQKPIDEILETIKHKKKIFLIGCQLCATTCRTGGEKEIKAMEKVLSDKGKKVTGCAVLDPACNLLEIKRLYRRKKKEINSSDALLGMSCGGGTQAVCEIIADASIFPTNDTLFQGEIKKITLKEAEFEQKCSLCGECTLSVTGAICPVTRCPKSLINGPCGGAKNGKCETDKDRDCVWIAIYERLKKNNKLEDMKKIRMPRDHEKNKAPRSLTIE